MAGLDDVLAGGLTKGRLYLLEGTPGTGKTTLALQFLLDGVARGETCLYVTLSESADELRSSAASHGWSLDGVELYELVNELGLDPESEQSVLHPSEVELGETVREVMERVDAAKPHRVVFDSLSELRLLAQNPLRYRRQILALKQLFAARGCTVFLLDDGTADVQLHSIAHGVFLLEYNQRNFGAGRRRLLVLKMRGVKSRGGYHDFILETGGITVFPTLVRRRARRRLRAGHQLDRGGPASTSCSAAGWCAAPTPCCSGRPAPARPRRRSAACWRRWSGASGPPTSCSTRDARRCWRAPPSSGWTCSRTSTRAPSPSPRSTRPSWRPASSPVASARRWSGAAATFVVLDSLNAYIHAMPGEQFLILQMHELLTYLNQMGVTTLLVLGQHGVIGDVRSDLDLSYLSDGVLLFRYFEAKGEVRTALSTVKSRVNAHERTIRELRFSRGGIQIGEALTDFEGVLSGLPAYGGKVAMLRSDPAE